MYCALAQTNCTSGNLSQDRRRRWCARIRVISPLIPSCNCAFHFRRLRARRVTFPAAKILVPIKDRLLPSLIASWTIATESIARNYIVSRVRYAFSTIERTVAGGTASGGRSTKRPIKAVQWLVRARKRKCPLSEASSLEFGE